MNQPADGVIPAGGTSMLLPLPLEQRLLVLAVTGGILSSLTAYALGLPTSASVMTIGLYALKGVLLLAPLAVIQRGHWLHPLIFIGVWLFVFEAIPESSLAIERLTGHPGLRGVSAAKIAQSVEIKLAVDCIAILTTYLGFLAAGNVRPIRLSHGIPRRVPVKLLGITAISLLAFAVLVDAAGGIGALALQRGLETDERLFTTMGGGHWHVVAAMIGPAVVVAAALMENPLKSPVLILAAVVAVATKFIVTGSRGGTLAIAIMLFFIIGAGRGRIPVLKTMIFAGLILVTIGAMTHFRRQSNQIEDVSEFQIAADEFDLMETAVETFINYSSEGNSDFPIYTLVPSDSPLILGRSYYAMIAAPIPRILWSGKPHGVGRLASRTFMKFKAGGVPPTAAGEAYWNFHLPGVLAVFLIWGALLRLIWKSVKHNPYPGVVALYLLTIYYLKPQTSSFSAWLRFMVPAALALAIFTVAIRIWPRLRSTQPST